MNILGRLRNKRKKYDGTISIKIELMGQNETVEALRTLAGIFEDEAAGFKRAADLLAKFPEMDEQDDDQAR